MEPLAHGSRVQDRDIMQILKDLTSVVHKALSKKDSGDSVTAVVLFILLLDSLLKLLYYCFDSYEDVVDEISSVVRIIGKTTKTIPPEYEEKVFDIIFQHSRNLAYSNRIDWRLSLLSALVPLCRKQANRDKMQPYFSYPRNMEKYIWIRENEAQQLQEMQHSIILRFDGEAAADIHKQQYQENHKQQLLAYCKKHIHEIEAYYAYLLPEYEYEVSLIFMHYIRRRAAQEKMDREHYRDVRTLLRKFKKACGDTAYTLRDELVKTYSSRPAFIKELLKV
jgi:CRISPR/Cas system-associated exonuclease Cas4 (RecB family)